MRRVQDDVELQLAPLIDVVFLLILFFVIEAAQQRSAIDYQVKLADSYHVPPGVPDPRTIVINLRTVSSNAPAVVAVGGMTLSMDRLRLQLVQAQLRYGSDVPIILRASEDVKYGDIDRVNQVITKAGLYRVRHATRVASKTIPGRGPGP